MMTCNKFYVAQIPNTSTVAGWLKKQTNWTHLGESIQPRTVYPKLLKFRIDNFDPQSIYESISEALNIYGEHPWRTSAGLNRHYTGFSLTYNPDLNEQVDPHASSMGTAHNSAERLGDYYDMGDSDQVKNTYYDCYGFNQPTPASQHGELGTFMRRSIATRVRSRLAIINGNQHLFRHKFMGWHVDEPIYQNLRINIPITTADDYAFQFEGDDPVHLDVGYAYAFDPHIRHRVFSTARTSSRRVHLVLGYSAWWNYLTDENAWIQNEHYGIKHPLDMLVDGEIIQGLELLDCR